MTTDDPTAVPDPDLAEARALHAEYDRRGAELLAALAEIHRLRAVLTRCASVEPPCLCDEHLPELLGIDGQEATDRG